MSSFRTHILLSLFLTLRILLAAQGNVSPEIIRLKEETTKKLNTYLVRDDSLRLQFQVTDEGFSFLLQGTESKNPKKEFTLFWDEIETWKKLAYALSPDSLLSVYRSKGNSHWKESFTSSVAPVPPRPMPTGNKPLEGIRIALDPGHVGGKNEIAWLEKKMIHIRQADLNGFPADVWFNEGNLTLGTGLLLKQMLEEAGATVMMTRTQPGQTAFGLSWKEWLQKEYPYWYLRYAAQKNLSAAERTYMETQATEQDKFQRVFRHADLEERARRINEFNPHLTVFIHYNVRESNRMDDSGYVKPVKDNFNMVFIPGAFLNHELDSAKSRVAFLRLLFSNDIERSKGLSASVLREFQRFTQVGVPDSTAETELTYLSKSSLRTDMPGVYARNLALNEKVKGPVCFGESLYQDNEQECIRLFSIDMNVDGFRVSPRVRPVAEAYYYGILNWVTGKSGN